MRLDAQKPHNACAQESNENVVAVRGVHKNGCKNISHFSVVLREMKVSSAVKVIHLNPLCNNLQSLQDVRNTKEFRKLRDTTAREIEALQNEVTPFTARIFEKDLDDAERLNIIGEAINITLLASDSRGGYAQKDLSKLKADLFEDFGIDGDTYATALGFTSFRKLMDCAGLAPFVVMTYNADGVPTYKGRPFENDLLPEFLNDQKLGAASADKK
jgi:hypothetical protein